MGFAYRLRRPKFDRDTLSGLIRVGIPGDGGQLRIGVFC